MKKYKIILIVIILTIALLAVYQEAHAQINVSQGGTGTTTVPANWFVKGSSAIRLTASQFINLATEVTGLLPNSNLANSSVSFGGVSVSLGGSDATPAFNLADATGLPISTGISGLATGIADWLATPSSANLDTAVTDDTGSGLLVFATSPSLTTPTVNTSLTLTDDDWIGLGSSAGLIEFDDQATDEVNILNANVGVGTASPDAKLEIESTSAGALVDHLLLTNSSQTINTEAGIFFAPTNAGGVIRGARISGIQEDGSNTVGLKFYTGVGASITEKMRITGGGNIGIGTSTPARLLDVYGTGQFRNALYLGEKGILHGFLNSDDSTYLNIDADASGVNGQAIIFGRGRAAGSGGTEFMRITDGGRLGLGTTTPQYQAVFVENNNTQAPIVQIKNSGGVGGSADATIHLQSGAGTNFAIGARNSTGNLLIAENSTLASAIRVAIANTTGNFGIGDVTPASLFTVGNGDLFQIDSAGTIQSHRGIPGSINLNLTSADKLTSVIAATLDTSSTVSKILFDADSDEEIYYNNLTMPENYNTAMDLKIDLNYSMASTNTGNVQWAVKVMAYTSGDALDIDTNDFDTVNTHTDAIPGTIGRAHTDAITLTNKDSVTGGDMVRILIYRDANHASDTATGDAELRSIRLYWD